jgi:hypothetical protein
MFDERIECNHCVIGEEGVCPGSMLKGICRIPEKGPWMALLSSSSCQTMNMAASEAYENEPTPASFLCFFISVMTYIRLWMGLRPGPASLSIF